MPNSFNCAPRFDEKVRIPTRQQVKDVCDKLSSKLVNQIYPVKDLVQTLANFIALKFAVNVLHSTAVEVDPGDINISAYYDFENDEWCKIAIEIVLITNPQETFIHVSEELYNNFVRRLADSLAHELIHMRQARARDFIPVDFKVRIDNIDDDEMMYLGNPDEIDAYSYNIAAELLETDDPLKKLSDVRSINIEESLSLWVYLNAFKQKNHPVIKKLLKKVYKNLDKRAF